MEIWELGFDISMPCCLVFSLRFEQNVGCSSLGNVEFKSFFLVFSDDVLCFIYTPKVGVKSDKT